MCNVRPMRPGELPTLVEIWEEAVSATHGFLSASDFAEIKTQLPEYFDKADVHVYEEGGAPEGFLGMAGDRIDMLFVRKRGRGIGTELLNFAVAAGARRIEVNEQNTKAAAFYKKYGFEVCGRSETDSGGHPYPLLYLELKK